MYYLIKETMGRKRCLSISETDIYRDDNEYDCLALLPFKEENLVFERSIQIRCTNAPGRTTSVDIYYD
jgi:hypothetical protein